MMNDDDVGKIWKCHVQGRIGNFGETGRPAAAYAKAPRTWGFNSRGQPRSKEF